MLSLALLAGSLVTNSSCKKLKDKLFQAFTTNETTIDFTIPVITDTTQKTQWGNITNNFNVDSIIKAETSGAFSLSNVKSIKITQLKMELTNADAGNNFANFQQGWAELSSSNKPTPVTINTGLNPDVFSESWTLPTVADVNVKDYMSASTLTYTISAKARRTTSKVLNAKLKVKYYIE